MQHHAHHSPACWPGLTAMTCLQIGAAAALLALRQRLAPTLHSLAQDLLQLPRRHGQQQLEQGAGSAWKQGAGMAGGDMGGQGGASGGLQPA